jgi:glyceraldehyde 3-phosphate dehydrogenase
MKTKVGINGFGRIGRNAFKIALEKERNFEIVSWHYLKLCILRFFI